jgi:hypothetical protein
LVRVGFKELVSKYLIKKCPLENSNIFKSQEVPELTAVKD